MDGRSLVVSPKHCQGIKSAISHNTRIISTYRYNILNIFSKIYFDRFYLYQSNSESEHNQVELEPSSPNVQDKMTDTENGVKLEKLIISEPTLEYSAALSQIKLDLPATPAR